MWDQAKERVGMKDDVILRYLGLEAIGAARRGANWSHRQKRMVHTSGKTTDAYTMEVISNIFEILMVLLWLE